MQDWWCQNSFSTGREGCCTRNLTQDLLCHHVCLMGDLQYCFWEITLALPSGQRGSGSWELLWGWMEKERVGLPGRGRGGGSHTRGGNERGRWAPGGSSCCQAAGSWPSPEPGSSCPGSSLLWLNASGSSLTCSWGRGWAFGACPTFPWWCWEMMSQSWAESIA